MKENFKIEKELLFKNNIKEITSISLDRDYEIKNNEVVGNFLISGDYRMHEVSINREKFDFKIPFKHKIANDIDDSSIDIEILDFLYDYKKDELMVNIDYKITGDRKDILIFEDEETLDDFLNKREVEVIDTRIDEIKEVVEDKEINIFEDKVKEVLNEKPIEQVLDNKEIETVKEEEEFEDREIKSDEIINSVNNIQDKFITYKIYKVMESDTVEGILLKYHTTLDEIKEYNELSNISVGDKIIIPINE